MPSPRIEFRATTSVAAELTARSAGVSPSDAARRDLARYYALLDEELGRVALTPTEALLLCDALNGVYAGDNVTVARHLDHEIEDAIELNQVDRKWEVDGTALVTTVRGWTLAARLAALDAVERWWARRRGNDESDETSLRAVGLLPPLGIRE